MRLAAIAGVLAACRSPSPSAPSAPKPVPEPVTIEKVAVVDPPANVAAAVLEASRISGDPNIAPDRADKVQMMQSGKTMILGSWKLCLDETGEISTIANLKSAGFSNYDRKVERELGKWRYRPYLVDGKAMPVCTELTFIHVYAKNTSLPPPSVP
jgi:hypothetical protein